MNPILFELGGIAFYSYGVSVFININLFMLIAPRYVDQGPLIKEHIPHLATLIVVAILFGGGVWLLGKEIVATLGGGGEWGNLIGRLFSLETLRQTSTFPVVAFFGLMLIVFCKRRELPFLPTLDFLIPFLVTGYGIHRLLGCFSAGCCYGAPTDLPWAVHFPETHGVGPTPGVAVHPTQVYFALGAFALTLLFRSRPGWREKPGLKTAIGAMGIFGLYFLIAFVRGDWYEDMRLMGMPYNQVFSLVGFWIGAALFVWASRQSKAAAP